MPEKVAILLSHVCHDGTKNSEEILKFCVKHASMIAPVILVGHGAPIKDQSISDFCSIFRWYDTIEGEVNRGHPKCVRIGLNEAKKHDFNKVFKMRADSACFLDNPLVYLEEILKKERSCCVVTAQTDLGHRIGDLFMYGYTDFLIDLWDKYEWNYVEDGMWNINNNFVAFHGSKMHAFKAYFSYRDCVKLKWCLLSKEFDLFKNSNIKKDFKNFLWDKYYPAYITENEYYSAQGEFRGSQSGDREPPLAD